MLKILFKQLMIKNIFGHLKTILIHKYWVFVYCYKFGIPWQGIIHDLSKFSWIEFSESVKYYQGGKKSPIPFIKKENGYSKAWQHHKGRNPHHYEYWTDNYSKGTTFIKIPFKYVLEMTADWLSAGRTYNEKNFTIQNEIDWWNNWSEKSAIHPDTVILIDKIFHIIYFKGWDNFKLSKKSLKINYENK